MIRQAAERLFRALAAVVAILFGIVLIVGATVWAALEEWTLYALIPGALGLAAILFGRSVAAAASSRPSARRHTGLHYDDFRFGDPPPTRKQFGYAIHLGVPIRHGMTKWDVSEEIDRLTTRR